MTLSRLSALMFASVAVGCSDAAGPRMHRVDEIRVTTAADHLRIDNDGNEPVFYAVFERDLLARILWAPSTTHHRSLAPGESAVITYDDLLRATMVLGVVYSSGEAVVFWWYAEEAGPDGLVPIEKVRSITVTID